MTASETKSLGPSGKGRVLFVIGSLAIGGAETQMAMLADRLVKRGWVVEIMPLDRTGGLEDRLGPGTPVIDGGYRYADGNKLRSAFMLIRAEIRLLTRIVRTRPSVVHSYLPLTNFMASVAARLAGTPRVITSKRALSRHQDRHPRLKWMDKIANRLSHRVTANSRAVAEDCAQRDNYPISRIAVIPNGLDAPVERIGDHSREATRSELGLSRNDIAIVMVANLIAYKGHRALLEAFARIAESRPEVRLFLVGEDRGMGPSLADDVTRLGISAKVRFLGRRSDVRRLLAAMDVGVLTSHEEGMSNALLEKLAAGLPVVATAVGGNPEALEGMPGCTLVPVDDPMVLAAALAESIDKVGLDVPDREVRRALVKRRHSVDAMVDAYEALYRGEQRVTAS